jgi:hypothetical protein
MNSETHRYTNTQQQNTQQWSKISTQLKNGHKQKTQRGFLALQIKTGQEIHSSTTHKRIASTQNASMRFFYALRIAATAEQHYKQRVGRFSAS